MVRAIILENQGEEATCPDCSESQQRDAWRERSVRYVSDTIYVSGNNGGLTYFDEGDDGAATLLGCSSCEEWYDEDDITFDEVEGIQCDECKEIYQYKDEAADCCA